MHLAISYHRNQLYKLAQHPDLNRFEFSVWLHTVARSLISVFVPVLMLKNGYSIQNIILFYLIYTALDIPLNYTARSLVRKYGVKKVMMLGTFATIAFFLILGNLPPFNLLVVSLLALILAIYDTTYWIAHIYVFYDAQNKEHTDPGESVGGLQAIRTLGSLIGPALGALLLIYFGNTVLVFASIAVFALSLVPLFRLKHVYDIPQEEPMPIKQLLSNKILSRAFLMRAFWGVRNEVESVLWPLFIYTLYGTIESIAAIPIIASLSTIIFSAMIGKFSKNRSKIMILVGTAAVFLVWVLRLAITDSALFYYGTIFAAGIFSLFAAIPLGVLIAEKSKQAGALNTSTYLNISSMSLRGLLYVVLFFSVDVFNVSFYVAAGAVLVVFLLTSFVKLDHSHTAN